MSGQIRNREGAPGQTGTGETGQVKEDPGLKKLYPAQIKVSAKPYTTKKCIHPSIPYIHGAVICHTLTATKNNWVQSTIYFNIRENCALTRFIDGSVYAAENNKKR